MSESISFIQPAELSAALAKGEGLAIDVREPSEIAAARIAGTRAAPLSEFERHLAECDGEPVFVICRSGARARQAAGRLAAAGVRDVRVLEGGILAWKSAGLPLERASAAARLPVWLLLAGGIGLGLWVHPLFYALAGFAGMRLMLAL